MSEFLSMGGYAAFVWSAYGIVCVVLAASLVATLVNGRRVRHELSRRLGRREGGAR